MRKVCYVIFTIYLKVLFTFYIRVKINGKLPNTPFIIAANHCSHLDSGVLISATKLPLKHCALLAAADYWEKKSFLKNLVRNSLCLIPISRGKRKAYALDTTISKAKQFINNDGKVIVIFPEGGRSMNGKLQTPLKHGAAILALKLNLPIVPIFIHGSYRAWPKGKTFMKPGRVDVYIGDSIPPQHRDNVLSDESIHTTTTQLERSLKRLSNKV